MTMTKDYGHDNNSRVPNMTDREYFMESALYGIYARVADTSTTRA